MGSAGPGRRCAIGYEGLSSLLCGLKTCFIKGSTKTMIRRKLTGKIASQTVASLSKSPNCSKSIDINAAGQMGGTAQTL